MLHCVWLCFYLYHNITLKVKGFYFFISIPKTAKASCSEDRIGENYKAGQSINHGEIEQLHCMIADSVSALPECRVLWICWGKYFIVVTAFFFFCFIWHFSLSELLTLSLLRLIISLESFSILASLTKSTLIPKPLEWFCIPFLLILKIQLA